MLTQQAVADLYIDGGFRTWDPGKGSLWVEVHRRLLENNRIVLRRWPRAARLAMTLIGPGILEHTSRRVAGEFGRPGISSVEDALDAAFRSVVRSASADCPEDRIFLDGTLLYDEIVSGRLDVASTGTVEFPFDVLYSIAAMEHYLDSHAPAHMIRDILPSPAMCLVEVTRAGGERILRPAG
jgi:hypothetical protein